MFHPWIQSDAKLFSAGRAVTHVDGVGMGRWRGRWRLVLMRTAGGSGASPASPACSLAWRIHALSALSGHRRVLTSSGLICRSSGVLGRPSMFLRPTPYRTHGDSHPKTAIATRADKIKRIEVVRRVATVAEGSVDEVAEPHYRR